MSTAGLRLRPLRLDDADEVAAVVALNQSNLDGVGPVDADRLRRLVGMTTRALVADDAGRLAGFALLFPPGTDYDSGNYAWFCERLDSFGYLDRIVVAPAYRRRGIAGRIYDAAEDESSTRGRLACEVYVQPPNVASLAFHAGRGYAEVGRLPQPNGKTCAMLVKELR